MKLAQGGNQIHTEIQVPFQLGQQWRGANDFTDHTLAMFAFKEVNQIRRIHAGLLGHLRHGGALDAGAELLEVNCA